MADCNAVTQVSFNQSVRDLELMHFHEQNNVCKCCKIVDYVRP